MAQIFDETFHRELHELDLNTVSLTTRRPPAKVEVDEVAKALRNVTILLKRIVDQIEGD